MYLFLRARDNRDSSNFDAGRAIKESMRREERASLHAMTLEQRATVLLNTLLGQQRRHNRREQRRRAKSKRKREAAAAAAAAADASNEDGNNDEVFLATEEGKARAMLTEAGRRTARAAAYASSGVSLNHRACVCVCACVRACACACVRVCVFHTTHTIGHRSDYIMSHRAAVESEETAGYHVRQVRVKPRGEGQS